MIRFQGWAGLSESDSARRRQQTQQQQDWEVGCTVNTVRGEKDSARSGTGCCVDMDFGSVHMVFLDCYKVGLLLHVECHTVTCKILHSNDTPYSTTVPQPMRAVPTKLIACLAIMPEVR